MRWYTNPVKDGQTRIKRRFLLLPLTLPNGWGVKQTRWLEVAFFEEKFESDFSATGLDYQPAGWVKTRWVDKISEQENWGNH